MDTAILIVLALVAAGLGGLAAWLWQGRAREAAEGEAARREIEELGRELGAAREAAADAAARAAEDASAVRAGGGVAAGAVGPACGGGAAAGGDRFGREGVCRARAVVVA
ncbi:MAG: hypothetical protein HND58_15650 [Planctomycetota bacterium]|nr:MAG: hypothetical protein HND58_15650 [Planctomycetota bacterium]